MNNLEKLEELKCYLEDQEMAMLINGDAIEELTKLENESVDFILTDPPYNISTQNNFKTMGRSGIDFGSWDKDFNQFSWLNHAFRVLKKGGSLVLFNSWKNLGAIAERSEELGLITKDCIRWIKDNPMPRNRDRRYIVDYEMGLWFVKKGDKWVFNRLSEKYDRPEYNYPIVAGKEKTKHPTQKPIKLMEEIILRHSNEGDIVLDPFMGSGSTGVACKNLNRKFIGIELDEEYFKIAKERIENEQFTIK